MIEEDRLALSTIHTNLLVILRVYNSHRRIDTNKLYSIYKDTYEEIICKCPWANITPSLHKLLAHSSEFISDFNDGLGLKTSSEEFLNSVNKHVNDIGRSLIVDVLLNIIKTTKASSARDQIDTDKDTKCNFDNDFFDL
ncbi:hypothetical protein LOD99_4813 [Oopsacas minuta]|uniref:Uncharacterized protein n=1 Tax=Oopsacas minuta TaxID=111878 RepID=A0AAV7JTS1_9METZ|nr:hypothetical protein LOD99_4813 [Oopsacas minuta]